MTKGQVKWFDPKKGYGFIIGPEGQDVFVHYSHIQSEGFRTLKDGEWVEYELVQGEKGWQARQVRAIGGTAEQTAGTAAPRHVGPPQSTPARPAAMPPLASGYEAGPGTPVTDEE